MTGQRKLNQKAYVVCESEQPKEQKHKEYCHGNVKQGLKNAHPDFKPEMRSILDRGFARLRNRPDQLLSFFHAAGLSIRKLSLI